MGSNAVARDFKEKVHHQMEVVKDKVVDVSKDAGRKIDEHAHKKPWQFVGVAAFFSVILGFFFGRKTK